MNQVVAPDWSMNWNITANADPFINGLVAVVNNLAGTQQFTLTFNQVTGPIGAPTTLIGGSLQGGLTSDATPGTLSTVAGSSFYAGLIDGATAPGAVLYPDPFSVSSGAFLSANVPSVAFGVPIPSAPGPAVLNDIGIQLDFSLTTGDLASFTSVFVVEPIPEPATGALVALGVIALAAARRRR